MRRRKGSDDIGDRPGSGTERGVEDLKVVAEEEDSSESRLLGVVLGFMGLILRCIVSAIGFAFHYMLSARLNTTKELYPYYVAGEHEPKSKFGYRFFLVSNRVQNIGFGFEYRGVYYFSNSHFCANGDKLEVDGRSIRLYHQGFTVLCSRKVHNMKKPEDDEDLYLLNPYMPTIRGKCIYKSPFYYSFFPINQVCRELTGLPIVNSRGELVSTYDNFRQVDDMVYNVIGDVNLWEESRSDSNAGYEIECILADHRDLRVFKVTSEPDGGREDEGERDLVGHFFSYNSITYISGAFIDNNLARLALSPSPEYHEGADKEATNRCSNLYRDLWVSTADCKHNLSLPELDEEATVLDVAEEKQGGVRGIVKMDDSKQFWAEFEGVPDKRCLGLPILNKAGQLIGVYSDFNVKNRFNRLRYSVYLGGSSTFKSHFLRMSLRGDGIQVLKVDCDLEILEQIVLLCSLSKSSDDQRSSGLVDRVVFGVGSEEISQKILDGINMVLNKHQYAPSHSESLVSVASHASTKYTKIQDKKFIIANTDWVGYSHLNSDNSFPFNSPKNLLVLLPHRSCMLTEELLDRYYKNTHKATRGLYMKFIPTK